MGKILSIILSLYLFAFGDWYPDFRKGVEVAKKENKLVMVYFYEEGCTYCKYMEEVVFIEPEVYKLMEKNFVVVPIDIEDPPDYLDRRFTAAGTPTFYIYDPRTDKIVLTIFGMQEAEDFIKLLKLACSKAKIRTC